MIHIYEDNYYTDLNKIDIFTLNRGNENFLVDKYGDIMGINGNYTSEKIHNCEEAVMSLTSIRSIMNIQSFDYRCKKETNIDNSTIYTLEQLYNEIPVFGGQFVINVSKDNVALSVTGKYIQNVDCSISDCISKKQAADLIKSGTIEDQYLIIYNNVPVWKLIVRTNNGYREKLIDGYNMSIFYDELMY